MPTSKSKGAKGNGGKKKVKPHKYSDWNFRQNQTRKAERHAKRVAYFQARAARKSPIVSASETAQIVRPVRPLMENMDRAMAIARIQADFVVARNDLIYICEKKIHRGDFVPKILKTSNLKEVQAVAREIKYQYA